MEPAVVDEPAPEPSDEPDLNLTQELDLMSGFQMMSVEDIETQYSFDLYSQAAAHADVIIDLADLQDATFVGISELILDADYTVLETSVAIRSSYLSSLTVGAHQFTMEFSNDQQVTVEITIADTTPVFSVSPLSAVYNIKEGSPHHADLTFTLAMQNTSFSGIEGMAAETDYSVYGDTVTISKEALEKLPLEKNQLAFVFSSSGSFPVTVVVYDGANTGALTPSSPVFDHAAPSDITVGMQLSGCTFVGIEGLTEGDEYTFADDIVTLSQAYLKTLIPGQHELTFILDCGDNIVFSLEVEDSVPVVQLIPLREPVYDKYKGSGTNHDAIHVRVLPMENPLAGILGLTTFPHAEQMILDPNDGIYKEVLLSISELDSLEIGEHTLYFVYEGPRFVPFTVTIMDTTPILYVDGVNVSAGSGIGWSYADNLLQITQSGLTVSGVDDTTSIQVAASVASITLDNLLLNAGYFNFKGGASNTLEINLQGTSEISGYIGSDSGNIILDGTGSLDVDSTSYIQYAIYAANIELRGGTISSLGSGLDGYAIRASTGTVTISGGNVTARATSNGTNSLSYGIYGRTGVNISGGNIIADAFSGKSCYGIYAYSGNVVISGGTVTSDAAGSSYSYGIYVFGSIQVSGGSVTARGNGTYRSYGLRANTPSSSFSGTDTFVEAIGYTSALTYLSSIMLNAQQTIVYDGRHTIYENGKLEQYRKPTSLKIGGITYDQTALNDNIAGNGWAWDWLWNQVTLQGYQGSEIVFACSSPLYLALAEGTENTITGTNGRAIDTGKLTISGSGSLTATGTGTGGNYGYGIYANNVTILSGEVTAIGNANVGDSDTAYGIYALGGNISISGGRVTAIANAGDCGRGMLTYNMTINGGVVKATGSGIDNSSSIEAYGDLIITGGSLEASKTNNDFFNIYVDDDINISGGTITVDRGQCGIFASDDISISGGEVTSSRADHGISAFGNLDISGGTIITSGEFWGLDAYAINISGTSSITAVGAYSAFNPAVVTVNGLAVNTSGWRYARYDNEVLQSIAGPTGLTIGGSFYGPSDLFMGIQRDDWTWDFGEMQLTLNGYNCSEIYCSGSSALNIFLAEGTKNVVVANTYESGIKAPAIHISGQGSLTANGYSSYSYAGIYAQTGGIVIDGGSITTAGGYGIYAEKGDVVIQGGTVKASGIYGIRTSLGSVTISGGTVLSYSTSSYSYGIYASSSIAISGMNTLVKSAGDQAAFSKSTITVNGQSVDVSGMKQVAYHNGAIAQLNAPNSLFIGGESYPIIDLLERNISGNGWAWNCEASLLTLMGYDGGKIVSTGPATLKISLEEGTQNNVMNPSGTAIEAGAVFFSGEGELTIHGSNAGIYAPSGVSFIGTGSCIRIWGSNIFNGTPVSLNGQSVNTSGWRHAMYTNGALQKLDTPGRLDIGTEIYVNDALFNDIAGTGWTWDWKTAQLILNGYTGDYINCWWDSSLQLVLAEGTYSNMSGIWLQNGSLTISGGGSLNIGSLQAYNHSISIKDSVVLAGQNPASSLTVQGGLFFTGSNHVYTLQSDSTISRDLVLPEGNRYTIPAGRSVTIGQGASLTFNGELVNNGTITGNIIAGSGNTTKISAISLNPSSKTIFVNESFTPATTITPSYAANKQVTWSSSNTAVAMVNNTGLMTGKKGGMAIIRATAIDGSDVYGQCTVTVKQYVTQITLSSTSVSVIPGKTVTLGATALPADASDKQVSWVSNNTAVATVSSAGVVTSLRLGTAMITATAKDGSGIKANCTVTVGQPVTGVTLSLPKITIGVSQAVSTVTTTVLPATAINKQIYWSSSNSTIAKVDATGKITGIKAGTATISATAADGSGKTESVVVTVVSAGRGVTAIKLSATSATVYVKKTLALKATITPSTASDLAVKWVSSNTAVATVLNGVVTGVAPGSATITAISSSGYLAACTITATDVPVSSVTLRKTTLTMLAGATYQLAATVLPADAKVKTLTWSSSNTSVATVDATGKVTAKALGTVIITARSNNGKTASCLVTVNPIKITALTLSPTSTTILIAKNETLGKQTTIKANITPSNATIRTLNWTTSNSKMATVDQYGVVKSIGYGTAIITAAAKDGSSIKAICTITVAAVKVASLKITGITTMAVGSTQKLTSTVLPANALNSSVTWTSSNINIATVDTQGNILAKTKGTVTITAAAKDGSGKKASLVITVK